MKKIDLTRHILEVGIWSRRNFPGKTPLDPAEGIVEEIGELAHARLKRRQGIRGTSAEHDAAEQDAIADAAVFLCDFASQVGVSQVEIAIEEYRGKPHDVPAFADVVHGGSNLFSVIDEPEVDDWGDRIVELAADLETYAYARGWDFMEILDRTWNEVSKRDWILYPGSGRPPEAP